MKVQGDRKWFRVFPRPCAAIFFLHDADLPEKFQFVATVEPLPRPSCQYQKPYYYDRRSPVADGQTDPPTDPPIGRPRFARSTSVPTTEALDK